MSDYRDDTQETVVIRDKLISGFMTTAESLAKLSSSIFFGIAILLADTAVASDEVIDSSAYIFNDSAKASDQVIDTANLKSFIAESARAQDSIGNTLAWLHLDSAIISDSLLQGTLRSVNSDSAAIGSEVVEQRTAHSLVTDSAVISDSLTAIHSDTSYEVAVASDEVTSTLSARDIITEQATATDTPAGTVLSLTTESAVATDSIIDKRTVAQVVTDSIKALDKLLFGRRDDLVDTPTINDSTSDYLAAASLIGEQATVADLVIDSIVQSNIADEVAHVLDEVIDAMQASDLLQDAVIIEDALVNVGGFRAHAWTANIDSWGMSRYDPYNFNRIVVIDGVLYGEAEDGIYNLEQSQSIVAAKVKTGKIDLSGSTLTHPIAAYLEYELDGTSSMTVGTTQKGYEQRYTYVLPSEIAGELTNGRFIFGRGLRGRHFSFELEMVGTHGHINDLTVEHAATKRRV